LIAISYPYLLTYSTYSLTHQQSKHKRFISNNVQEVYSHVSQLS
jgi:hypothetical protein